MTTRYSGQFRAARRSQARFLSSKAVSIALVAAAATIWAWFHISDAWNPPVPWWVLALIWFLVAGFPFLLGLAAGRWTSALIAPAGIIAGTIVALMTDSGYDDLTYDVGMEGALLFMAVWAGVTLAPWAVGYVIRKAITARRRLPREY